MHHLKLSRTIYQQSKDYDDTLKFLYKSYLLGTQNFTLSTITKIETALGENIIFFSNTLCQLLTQLNYVKG